MKKIINFHTDRAHQNKNQKPHCISPSIQQFELISHTNLGPQTSPLPSPSAKKSASKQTHSKRKANPQKQQSIEQLQRLVSELQRKLKMKDLQQLKAFQVVKSGMLKQTTKQKSKIYCVNTGNSKSRSRLNKYQKQNSMENDKKYKHAVSPSNHNKQQPMQTKSNKFLRSTQSTFRPQPVSKCFKKGSKQTVVSIRDINLQDYNEYVLLEDNFVQLCPDQAHFLTEKILSSRHSIDKESLHPFKINHNCLNVDSPINQEEDSVEGELYNFVQDHSSITVQNNHTIESITNIDLEIPSNNLETQIVNQIILIQRWWRNILLERDQRQSRSIIAHKLDDCAQDEKSMIASEMFESALIIHDFESSPRQMYEHNFEWRDNQFNISLEQRAEAATIQMRTHKQILQALFKSKKVTQQDYDEKTTSIQVKYNNELKEIEEIKKLLRMNVLKAENMALKTNEDIALVSHIGKVDDELLDRIFGQDLQYNSHEQGYSHNAIMNAPTAEIDVVIIKRQKSTGCHYDPKQKDCQSIYSKTEPLQQEYRQDFEEEEEDQDQDLRLTSLNHPEYTQNGQDFQSVNSNYQSMMEQLRMREQVKIQIDRRAAQQMGITTQQMPKQLKDQYFGIETSLNSVHRFLLSFFKFYIFHYRDDFLRLVNMPYGYSVRSRISAMHGYEHAGQVDEDENGVIYGLQQVIPNEALDQFYQKIYEISSLSMTEVQRANFVFDRIHSKALFDSLNEALNHFRPYFLINGQPYPWNNSQKALTFYFIAQENIQEVFEKSQFKVLKWASSLCGILVNKLQKPQVIREGITVEETLQSYQTSSHPLLAQTKQDRLSKDQKVDVAQSNFKWAIVQEQRTQICLQTSDFVFDLMIEELLEQIYHKKQVQNVNNRSLAYKDQMRKSLYKGLQLFQTIGDNSQEQIQIY